MQTKKAKLLFFILSLISLGLIIWFKYTNIDLNTSTKFYNFQIKLWLAQQNFLLSPWFDFIYKYGPLPQVLLLNLALALLACSYLKIDFLKWRQKSFFVIFSIITSEIIVELLKQIFARPRPRDVIIFGGDFPFAPLLTIGEQGLSFPSSHAKSGFILVVLFVIFYFKHFKLAISWFIISLVLGIALSITRLAQGGHFLSDVLFGGLVSYFTVLLLYFIALRLQNFQTAFIPPSRIKRILLPTLVIMFFIFSIIAYINKFW